MSMPPPKDELPELPEDALAELPELPELPEVHDMAPLPSAPHHASHEPKEPAPVKPPTKPEPAPVKPPSKPEPAPVKPPLTPEPIQEPTPAPAQPEPPPITPPMAAAEPQAAMQSTADAMAEERPAKRDLAGAPLHLQKAALIALVGGLIPWQTYAYGGPMSWAVGKVVLLAGAWLLWKSVDFRSGTVVPGFVASLGKIVLSKQKDTDPKAAARRAARQSGPTKLDVPFPTALHLLGLGLLVLGCFFPLFDGAHDAKFEYKLKSVAELGMLAWAVGTWIHIYAYERWASFSPIYPMIFIGLLVAGLQKAVASITADGGLDFIGFAGGLTVGIGGGMAAYTIVESMMEAKREGDAKKALEIERRKSARERKTN